MEKRVHFTGLEAWKESIIVVSDVKEITLLFRGPDAPRASKHLNEAADAISANIAEGYGKGFTPDNLRYLRIALSSADEVESRLRSSIAAGRISAERADIPLRRVRRVQSLIMGLSRYVEAQIRRAS
jgi:four helix bundle protein